jgi:hypothetical protein
MSFARTVHFVELPSSAGVEVVSTSQWLLGVRDSSTVCACQYEGT